MSEYEVDLAVIDHSGPHEIDASRKQANRDCRELIADILPIDDIHKSSDCDLIYRFLIAHRWDCQKAADALRAYADWRAENKLNSVLWESFPNSVQEWRPKWRGTDIFGHPVCYDRPDPRLVGVLLKEQPRDLLLRAHFVMMEQGRRLCKAMNTDRVTMLIDMSQLGAAVFTNPSAIGFLKEMSKLDQIYYPENIRTMVICNAGMTFNLIWRIIRPLLDERVQKKIQFAANGSGMVTDIAKWISLEHVPASYGGQAPDDSGERPTCLVEVEHLPPGSPTGVPVAEATGIQAADATFTSVRVASDDDLHSAASSEDRGSPEVETQGRPQTSCDCDSKATSSVAVAASPATKVPREVELFTEKHMTTEGLCLTTCFNGLDTIAFRQGSVIFGEPRCLTIVARIAEEKGHPIHTHLVVCDEQSRVKFIVRKHSIHSQLDVFKPSSPQCLLATDDGRSFSVSDPARIHQFDVLLQPGSSDKRDWGLFSHTRPGDMLANRQGSCIMFRKELSLPAPSLLFALSQAIGDLWHFKA